ncbi:alpha/beta hydrolase [Phyllobacterium phragmitis]|uniref:Alpha/beta hydrolase n=1 Tax=Phyllobacterium phragmitis TaxID=2670329 RepID=A0A2S9IQK4_9HYPH|nr:alpha/beta hydrolase [Phyllobacterium phragmitis]PRD42795.1 alpha/beta hydrolase [Phyllobacterium phragmitis]
MIVKKRLVLNFTGYEGLHPGAVRGRHMQAIADFDRLWHARTSATPMQTGDAGCGAMQFTTQGADWQTEVEFCQFGTADIFDDYAKRPTLVRLLTGLRAFLDILLTGTLWRYARTSWRFVLFFLWPFGMTLALVGLAALVAAIPFILGLGPLHLIWSLPLAVIAGAVLMRWPGKKFFLSYLLDDWSAAYDRIHAGNPKLNARRQEFAAILAQKLKETDADEAVIVGHSLGTVPAVEAIAQVRREHPELLEKQPVSLLSIGSCLLMLAFHPKAKSLREDIRTVLQETPVLWAEFQTLTDIIHFYGSDPAEALAITPTNPPVISRIRFKNVHNESRYKRAKGNFFKMHLLFLKGAQKRNAYDIGMFLHGPFALSELVTAHKGKAAPLDEEGRLNRAVGQ